MDEPASGVQTVRMLSLLAPTALLFLGSCSHDPASAAPRADGEFEALWYDGQAEVAGYVWKGSRYGELRTGEAVAIFVTETLAADTHVKLDDPSRGGITVLKLNLVREFQTGIYDYDTMTSAFAEVGAFRPLRVTFSCQEWCGQAYEALDVGKKLGLEVASYFEGESTATTLTMQPDALLGDHLFVWLRGLRGHVLAPGETRELPYLADGFERRLRHAKAEWQKLTVTRAAATASESVPAGTFPAVVYTLVSTDGRTGRVAFEEAYPHRLLAWSWSRGAELLDSGALTGAKRLQYWKLQKEGEEALRAELGLSVR
jgi:hypothetical protein